MTVRDAELVAPGSVGPTWAVVPFRGRSGKRRLAGLLDDEERGQLVHALLGDVLAAVLGVPTVERVLVVAPLGVDLADVDDALIAGAARRVVLLPERAEADCGPSGLNPALAHAQSVAVEAGVSRLLIVPADLPLLRPSDVAALLGASAALPSEQGVVIAPNAAEDGTNALVLAPPSCLSPRFGLHSFRAHVAQADQRGIPRATVRRPGLALDLDLPVDIVRLLESGLNGRTVALVRALRLGERLAVVAPA